MFCDSSLSDGDRMGNVQCLVRKKDRRFACFEIRVFGGRDRQLISACFDVLRFIGDPVGVARKRALAFHIDGEGLRASFGCELNRIFGEVQDVGFELFAATAERGAAEEQGVEYGFLHGVVGVRR